MDNTEATEENVNFNVIIIGGGIAGISAAGQLLKNGIDKILVLEAQDYLGGRIRTINTEYGHIDLGAEWIHGQQGNPLYDLAASHQLVEKRRQSFYISHSSASLFDEQEFRTENGTVVEKDTVCEVSNIMEDLYEMSLKDASTKTHNIVEILPDVHKKSNEKSKDAKSFDAHFANGFKKYLESFDSKEINHDTRHALFRWRLKWELTDNCCESLNDVAYPGRYLVCDGHGISDLKAGFQTVFDILKADVPEHYIRLCKPVKQITWNRNFSLVDCLDGSFFKGKYVIVTVPIGYLKKHVDTMFSPPLPDRKLNSIRNCGFETTVKVFFAWNKPFWKESFSGVQFVWMNNTVKEEIQDEIKLCQMTERLKSDGNPWYNDLTGFERCRGRPNVLIGWVAGEGATLSAKVSDVEMSKVFTILLRTFCQDRSIPEPDGIYRSRWESNKYVCGGYSYVSMRNTEGDYDALCESLPSNKNPRVLFAGEATSFNYYSTTHGAYESGIRSAENIIKIEQTVECSSKH